MGLLPHGRDLLPVFFSALRELPGQEVALLSYMDPLVAVIVSVTVLGEPVTAPQLAGGALILGFTLWNELPEKKKKKGSGFH